MKKSTAIAAGVIVLAGAWLGGTWYTGQTLQVHSARQLAALNEQLAERAPAGMNIQIQERALTRGFFASQARYVLDVTVDTTVSFGPPDGPLQFQFELDVQYQHGPFPSGALARGQLMPQMAFVHTELRNTGSAAPWFALTRGQTPLAVDNTVSYGGNAQFSMEIAPIKWQPEKGFVDFAGFSVQGSVQGSSRHLTAEGRMPAFHMLTPEQDGRMALRIEDMRLTMDSQPNRFGTNSGTAQWSADKFSVARRGQPLVDIGQLVYGVNLTDDAQFVHSELYLRADTLDVKGQPLGSPSLGFKFNRLDGETLARGAENMREWLDVRENRIGMEFETFTEDVLQYAQDLLQHNPELVQTLEWKNDKGRSTQQVNVVLQPLPQASLTDLDTLVQDLQQTVKSVAVEVELNQPMLTDLYVRAAPLAGMQEDKEQIQAGLEQALMMLNVMGLTNQQGDTFKSSWRYDGEKVSVNGREMPLEGLMRMFR